MQKKALRIWINVCIWRFWYHCWNVRRKKEKENDSSKFTGPEWTKPYEKVHINWIIEFGKKKCQKNVVPVANTQIIVCFTRKIDAPKFLRTFYIISKRFFFQSIVIDEMRTGKYHRISSNFGTYCTLCNCVTNITCFLSFIFSKCVRYSVNLVTLQCIAYDCVCTSHTHGCSHN